MSGEPDVVSLLAAGRSTFMGVELEIGPGALVPRAETEILGKTALAKLREIGAQVKEPRVIDMCCGAGNLGCALAVHVPASRVWMSDLTDGTVALARRNVERLGLAARAVVGQGDLFAGLAGLGLEGTIDLLVANPPYISTGKLATDRAELLEHEPREAFDAGPYGIALHQRIIREAPTWLRDDGWLMFEFGLGQEKQIKSLVDRTKAYDDVGFVNDAAGNPRAAFGRKKKV